MARRRRPQDPGRARGAADRSLQAHRARRPEDVEVLQQHDRAARRARGHHEKDQDHAHRPGAREAQRSRDTGEVPGMGPAPRLLGRGTQEMGAQGLHHRGNRMPGMQAAGDRGGDRRAETHARARADLSRRPDAREEHSRRRQRQGAQARRRDHARRAGSNGTDLHMSESQPEAQPIARLYGEPVIEIPADLYIPPDALEIMLEAFQGPLDLLLYLIRKQNLDILDIPMAPLTRQYLEYIEMMRNRNFELAAEY